MQLDHDIRFMRCFICVGSVVDSLNSCIPVMSFDGEHCRSEVHNGALRLLTAIDGNHKNVPVAAAYVPVKNKKNIKWFLTLCIEAKAPLSEVALYVDRGYIRSVVSSFANRVRLGEVDKRLLLNLKHCTMHIWRNFKHKFKLTDNDLVHKKMLYTLQESETRDA